MPKRIDISMLSSPDAKASLTQAYKSHDFTDCTWDEFSDCERQSVEIGLKSWRQSYSNILPPPPITCKHDLVSRACKPLICDCLFHLLVLDRAVRKVPRDQSVMHYRVEYKHIFFR